MSKLDDLIRELCPNGVEYKSFNDISIRLRGMSGVSKKWHENGNCKFIEYKNAYDNLKINIHQLPFATVNKLDSQTTLKQGDILFTSASETPDECAISSVIEDAIIDGVFLDDHLFGIRLKDKSINATYLNYYCQTNEFRRKVKKVVRGVTRFYISLPDFMKIVVPIPPLPVQEEIVRILDNFTELTNELTEKLTAELTARKKQYEYYRDSLFEFEDQTPKVKLGDIASINRGGNFQKKDFSEEGVPCIHYGQIYTYYGIYTYETLTFLSEQVAKKSKKAMKNDVIMAVTSENVEDVCKCVTWLGDEDVCVSGHTAIIQHNQNPKYLSYFFHSSNFFSQKLKLAHGTKVIEVTPSTLKNVIIPLPSLEEQQHIVDILDRFDKLCNDITEGLPAEIEARQKQYEYYRDKLLTFKPLEEVK